MTEKAKSMLRLAKKAGKITLGYDATVEEIKKKRSCLVIIAKDLSYKTFKKLGRYSENIIVNLSMIEIYEILGKTSGIISVNEKGFAKEINRLLLEDIISKLE